MVRITPPGAVCLPPRSAQSAQACSCAASVRVCAHRHTLTPYALVSVCVLHARPRGARQASSNMHTHTHTPSSVDCCRGLVLRAMGEPWEPWEAPPPYRVRAAAATSAPWVTDYRDVPGEGEWRHSVVRCERTLEGRACFLNVHLLRLADKALAHRLNAFLTDLALQKEGEHAGCSRSNVGGFHSADDLWSWTEVQDCALPALVDAAVGQVREHERCLRAQRSRDGAPAADAPAPPTGGASDVSAAAVTARSPHGAAWLNVSRGENWNHLHTHPGATFSGCYYVADAGCSLPRALAAAAAAAPDSSLAVRSREGGKNHWAGKALGTGGVGEEEEEGVGEEEEEQGLYKANAFSDVEVEGEGCTCGTCRSRTLAGRLMLLPGCVCVCAF